MTLWKIVLISGVTTTTLVALLVVVGALAWPTLAGWHDSDGAWRGIHGGHGSRSVGFDRGRAGHLCAHLDEAGVAAHADLLKTFVGRSLSLDEAQQALFAPIVAAMVDGVQELRPLCDADHGGASATVDARTLVHAASTIAEVSHRGLQRIDSAFAVFYDALEPGQREILDGWVAHAHRRHR